MKKDTQDRMDKAFDGLREEFGDIFRLKLPGHGNMVVIFRPEDIKTLYMNEGKNPIVPAFQNLENIRKTVMKDRYASCGLLNNGEDWCKVRHLVQQDMMRPKSALYYIPEMEEIAGELVKKINMVKDKDELLDPSEVLHEYAAEAVGSVFMGARLGALQGMEDGRRLIKNQEQAMLEYMKIFLFPPYLAPYHPAYWKFVALCNVNFDICKKYVDQAIARGTHTDESVMAKLVRKCGKDSPIPLIMVIDALQVGIDTTGSTATLLLYHLASNQDKQERLYQEICDVLGPNGQMTEAALSKMKYLKACQTESQRILPATFGSSRLTTQDMVFGDYQIPAGTTVFRCGSSSNDPNNFTNPEKFLPERWLRGCPERHNAHSFANTPFGHGARSCIGQRFAKLELYMMMVKVVQKFHMEYTGEKVGLLTQFISVPDKSVNIRFTNR